MGGWRCDTVVEDRGDGGLRNGEDDENDEDGVKAGVSPLMYVLHAGALVDDSAMPR
jgi:hypothetical protein